MGRKATGEIRHNADGSVSAIVRTFDKREAFRLHPRDDAAAKVRSALVADVARRFRDAPGVNQAQAREALRAVAGASPRALRGALDLAEELLDCGRIEEGPGGPTFGKVAEQWTSGELARLYPDHVRTKNHDDDIIRLTLVCSFDVGGVKLGDIPIDRLTLEHAEAAMRQLPARAKRPATRRHYAQVIHRVLALAVWPLRLISVHPLPKGFMPKIGKPPAYHYLRPAEDAQLMSCPKVTIQDRVFYGFLDREGPRVSEAAGFQIRDFDLELGAVSLDENKTDDPRSWALDPGVTRALRAYVARYRRHAKPTDLMFTNASGEPYESAGLAARLRNALRAAGVKREELFSTTTARGRLRAHDLRGTFVTLSLANGKTETWVADRTGHKSSDMINRYRRAARSAKELALGALLPLDEAIPEFLPPDCHSGKNGGRGNGGQVSEKTTKAEVAELADAADSKSQEPQLNTASIENHTADVAPRRPSSAREWQESGKSAPPSDPVEAALADALRRAAAVEQWTTVEVLSRELTARREARSAVVDLEVERKRRKR